jgi:hypothetical protein
LGTGAVFRDYLKSVGEWEPPFGSREDAKDAKKKVRRLNHQAHQEHQDALHHLSCSCARSVQYWRCAPVSVTGEPEYLGVLGALGGSIFLLRDLRAFA